MSYEDPYLTMSITSPGPATLPAHEKKVYAPRSTNDISDIDGARPQPKYKVYANKPQFLNSDIPGATSKQLIRGRNVRDNSLYIDDIDGTRRTIKDRMMRTNRHVDPLQPNYPLPTFVPTEPVTVPFKRDPLNISDIEGTKPKPKQEFAPKDTMFISDIEGARPGLRETKLLNTMQTRDILDRQDISKRTHRYSDRTHRVTDPIAPTYHVNGMEIKDGKECKPRAMPAYMNGNHLLQTKDITGAVAGTRSASPFTRREFRNTNFIGDIEGSKADSIKHSITTNRASNPLQPVYQSLDPGELLLPLIPPLIPADMIKIPTLPALNREKSAQASLVTSKFSAQPGSADNNQGLTNTWGGSSDFGSLTGGFNFADDRGHDLDPVLFTAPSSAPNPSGKPPTGKQSSLALPYVPNSAGENGQISGKDRAMNTANNIFSHRSGGPSSNQPSARGGTQLYAAQPRATTFYGSPMVSGRGGHGQLTPSQRRAESSRAEEINLVRQLQ